MMRFSARFIRPCTVLLGLLGGTLTAYGGPVYFANVIAQTGIPVAGVTINNINSLDASMSGNGNIVFYALDSTGTNHLFTDIGGQVSIADPLGSGPNFTYNGQARINDSGQVAYFGSPDNKTIATHPYLGTTELSTHAGGSIDGLNDAGTVLWSQQDNNGAWSLFTQSGTVAAPYDLSLIHI